MFGFFKSKNKEIKSNSRFALTRQGAYEDLIKQISPAKKPVFVFYYFEESKNYLKELLSKEYFSVQEITNHSGASGSDVCFINARTFNPLFFKFANIKTLYCIDHYPMHSVFSNLLIGLGEIDPAAELITYGGLDEPILDMFGGERIRELMQKMGLNQSEIIEHAMISGAMENAQKKIEAKVTVESKANSASEWFKLNYHH